MNISYAPNRLLDTLAEWLRAANDRQLSRLLQISLPVIQGIRSGRISLSPSLLLMMAECAGKTVDELRQVLGERRSKARMPQRLHRQLRAA
ncbi:hypothetical protein [Noviherbaspirillum aridicola]|uniref:HTH cro/C1-type domain-containing protein n=1 Tax=Noviherbaspirillum aridicola TaxID=2849687 RepID=A0ABQ4Q820_9BURK|nr:hypothetical protein [Noviherbaspirillum aridicola]GIZ53367.1 hypothetical protein NCCP691_33810 [Noviherbaspirillum aridicola]